MKTQVIFANLVNQCMKQENNEDRIKQCIEHGIEEYPLDSVRELINLLQKLRLRCVSKKDKSGKICTSCNAILNLPKNKLQQIETSCEEKQLNGRKIETHVEQKQFYYKKED